MKKICLCIVLILFSMFSFVPLELNASAPTRTRAFLTAESVDNSILLARLRTIKELDKSELTTEKRRALRKEARLLKIKAKNGNGGIYLSVGAVIIIVLLLIILL